MENKLVLNHEAIQRACSRVVSAIENIKTLNQPITCYPVPRGGIPCAYALGNYISIRIIGNPDEADFILDDLIDSGATCDRFKESHPDTPFFALFKKSEFEGEPWLIFPWEQKGDDTDETVDDNIVRILQFIGDNPERGGLIETPKRVIKAYRTWFSGYGVDPASVLKVFEDGAENYDSMVVVKDLPFYSHCEHHIAPFFGTATIAYIPNGKIVGLSKLSRLLDIFARRLQVQERLTNQVANAINKQLSPLGVGVIIRARHLCMESRGIQKQGHETITSTLHGVIRDKADARAEFMSLI